MAGVLSPTVDEADVKCMFYDLLTGDADIVAVCAGDVFCVAAANPSRTPTHSTATFAPGEVWVNLKSIMEMREPAPSECTEARDCEDSETEISSDDEEQQVPPPPPQATASGATVIQNNFFCAPPAPPAPT